MCLGIPAKITEIYRKDGLLMGRAEIGGITKEICLEYTPEAKLGDYVIVHVGFAISILDEAEAQEMLATLRDLAEEFHREENLGAPGAADPRAAVTAPDS